MIIWGGTGNFKVLCELLQTDYNIVGFFDNNKNINPNYKGIPYLGDTVDFDAWTQVQIDNNQTNFVVSLGPGHGRTRLELHDYIATKGLQSIKAIHSTAYIASGVEIGEGSMIYARATIAVDAKIGRNCLINTSASVDHECRLEDGVSIGPGAILAGEVWVKKFSDIYTGAIILPRVTIGEGAVIGAGAVVLNDVEPYSVMVGNPARILKKMEPKNA